jgi:hypothetical protein
VDLSSGLSFATSYTNAPGGSTVWSFAGGVNYNDATGTALVTIEKADANIAITDYSGTYDAAVHTASGTATGVSSVDLSSGLSFATSYTNAPGGSTVWSFAGGVNYNDATGTALVTIGKADADIAITDYSGTYDAAAHTASGTATGVSSVDLSSGLSFATSYTNAPGGSTVWSFAGGVNYNDATGTALVTIGKADANIAITDYSGTYDAAAHTASGTATGVSSVDLSSGLSFATSYTNAPGGSTGWSFAGGVNYNDATGTALVTIGKAESTTVVSIVGAPFTYTGLAQTPATVSVTGAGGLSETPTSVVYTNNTAAGTANASYTYAGDGNHLGSNDSKTFAIGQKTATVVATAKSKTYGTLNPGLTELVTGIVNNDVLDYTIGTTATQFSGVGIYPIAISLGINPNYSVTKTDALLTVGKKTATVSAGAKSKTYGDLNPGLTEVVTGTVNNDVLDYTIGTTATQFSGVGTYPIAISLGINPNYSVTKTDALLTVGKKTATVSAGAKSKTYGDLNPGLTEVVTGTVNNDVLDYTIGTTATQFSGVGTYPIAISLGTNPNYSVTKTDALLTITKASISVVNTNRSKVYGATHTNADYTGSIMGVVAGDAITVTRASTGDVSSATVAGSTYPIVGTLIDLGNRLVNYTVLNPNGALTVTKAATIITVANASGTSGGYTILSATLKDVSNNLPLNGKSVCFKVSTSIVGTATTDVNGIASLIYNTCLTSGATIQADFVGDSNYLGSGSTNTAILLVTAPTYVWSGTNVTGTPQQLPTSGGVNITPTVTFTGLTLTNVSINWDDNTSTSILGTVTNSVTSSHNYSAAGVYAPKITGTDVCTNNVISIYQYIVIYDPNGGFVTGGGWINSPAGAYKRDLLLTGKANFGFVAKYKKGSTSVVEGETEFQFQTGNLKFNSSSYENMSLVIGGAKASYKGTGTINGAGSYKFMLTAIDGDVSGGGGVDKLRMKITDINGIVVYDNQINTTSTGDNADPITTLGGGSIVIHEVKKGTIAKVEIVEKTSEITPFDVKIYPNPAQYQFNLKLLGGSDEKVEVSVYDILGRMVKHIANSDGQEIKFGEELPSGSYIAIVSQGSNQKTVRLIKE